MTRPEKQLKDEIESKERTETSQFLKRMRELKVDPAIAGYADKVSGLLENNVRMFVCSEHVAARFSDEQEVKTHFRKMAHRLSALRRSSSMYD